MQKLQAIKQREREAKELRKRKELERLEKLKNTFITPEQLLKTDYQKFQAQIISLPGREKLIKRGKLKHLNFEPPEMNLTVHIQFDEDV